MISIELGPRRRTNAATWPAAAMKWGLPPKSHLPVGSQDDAFSSASPKNRERARNKPADCKTPSSSLPLRRAGRHFGRKSHFVVHAVAEGWAVTVNRLGRPGVTHTFASLPEANRFRQALSDAGLPGYVEASV